MVVQRDGKALFRKKRPKIPNDMENKKKKIKVDVPFFIKKLKERTV
jgi:hypothetical protein